MAEGFFITFEGIEGSGKTTQIRLLADYLQNKGYEVLVSREPGGTPLGEKIRNLLLDPQYDFMDYRTEVLLYAADRAQHVKEKIKPALGKGKIVISDRFADSNLAYQAAGRGLDYEMVYQINDWVIDSTWPDLTFILDIDIKEGLNRARSQSSEAEGDRLEREADEFHQRVRDAYLKMAEKERFALVNAGESIENVQKNIENIISRRLF
ncbi:dTMP kinase [Halanaerobium congolense]|uniref:Thymidylate kinase n=1 Tax=Halanaerobium congolense TaxID=54121 RepID=A0A1M7LFU6_9FIRM|nr:dTMP kinase [Halanaerobium congolense]KXS48502.1 MAG: dTMP kinase [Halanaerobium sp. T82-1]TDP24122.1 thymidylate kinase [Halanaerobium congolense]TDS33920.1 thymidylate kinase [Halanaerobium congolense]SDK58919.1 thymidylate kinase [Halanaerobium congolense]SDM17469.1 thymidylate kinase [Halanaerobium congolense]